MAISNRIICYAVLIILARTSAPSLCHATFAYGTPILTSSGTVAIEQLRPGDSILTYEVEWNPSKVQTAPYPVVFSNGVCPGQTSNIMMVFLVTADRKTLIVSFDQPMLLSSGRMKQAGRLSPTDFLVRPDGTQIAITQIAVRKYNGGVHSIATSNSLSDSLDGHIISAGGLLAGDYSVQITNQPDAEAEGDESGPTVKTYHPYYSEYVR